MILLRNKLSRLINLRTFSSAIDLKKTALHGFHIAHGAKMVPFAGYSMPLQYNTSIIDEHNHVRKSAGLFDVSHMMQSKICGAHRKECMEFLTICNLNDLNTNQSKLSLFLNENGGIIDDLIISNCEEPYYYLVSNAGTAEKVLLHLNKWFGKFHEAGKDVRLESIESGLLALQGPKAASVIQSGIKFDLEKLKFMNGCYAEIFGIERCRITRCGYTGEDGFEISVPSDKTEKLASELLNNSAVLPIGLAARDTLRLEAGLCLYGNDIGEDITPVEATLSWTIDKQRALKTNSFLGQETVMNQLNKTNPAKNKRIGLIGLSGPPPRFGSIICNDEGEEIGKVTSGCKSPLINQNIAMGYVPIKYGKNGTKLHCKIRNKLYPAMIKKMPFVDTNYYA